MLTVQMYSRWCQVEEKLYVKITQLKNWMEYWLLGTEDLFYVVFWNK